MVVTLEEVMHSVGVRELKQHTCKILRAVRDKGEAVEVTYHGRVVARLVPVPEVETSPEEAAEIWSELDRLAAEIGARWPAGVTAAEAVSEGRRSL